MAKRTVEVFTAGCPLCDETVKLVQSIACPDCEVTVYDLHAGGVDRASQYGISRVPTVVVDGNIAACCVQGGPNEADLRAAGIGQPI